MAIPKVCGIENEYGFIILDAKGSQVGDDIYDEIVRQFVEVFLADATPVRYNQSQESPLIDVFGQSHAKKLSLKELLHRLWLELESEEDAGGCGGFLLNGARVYLDVTHPEYSTPECLTPLDLVAHDKAGELAMLRAKELFLKSAESEKYHIWIHKNNSDGFGNSYGSHLNVLLDQKLIGDRDKFKYLLRQYVPFQICRMILIGGGKIGAENDRPMCQFQISQRADFFEHLTGIETTVDRPIFNLRNEPHADPQRYFRLHDISTDSLKCEQAIFLKVALTQIVLAMIEDKFLEDDWFPQDLVGAVTSVSRDLEFKNPIVLRSGKRITGLELLRRYLLKAKAYLNQNPMEEQHQLAVKQALDLLGLLEKDLRLAFGKLDWATAWALRELRPETAEKNILSFQEVSPQSLYDRLSASGKIYRLLTDEAIKLAQVQAPINTRAHLRHLLIKKFGNKIEDMHWSSARVKTDGREKVFSMDNPVLDKTEYASLLSELRSR